MHHQMLRLEATLKQAPEQAAAAPQGLGAAASVAPASQLAELATQWVRAFHAVSFF